MNKPSGYEEARVTGERIPIRLGGHYCVIKQVSETKSKKNKDMIVVLLDFDQNDDQAGVFTAMFKGDTREDKKWPFAGSKYIMVNDYNDPTKTSSAFKTFCTCVEKSNNCKIAWGGDNWAGQFKGKKIGAVYGNVENEYEGKRTFRQEIRWFRIYDTVAGAGIPDDKLLPEPVAPAVDLNTFMPVPDDEIPF